MTTETELRDRLHSAAYRAGSGGDDLVAADAVIARRRSERRQRAGVLAAAVCVLLIAVLVPVMGGRWLTRSAPASPAGPTPTTVTPAPTDRWSIPPRGSLAGDRTFLQAARALPWRADSPPPAGDRTVVFAGDAEGIRWLLVAGSVDGSLTGQWFTGPAGTPAAALTPEAQEELNPRLPISHVQLVPTGAALLVLTDPGNEVEVSTGVLVAADGRVHRGYVMVPAGDGVAVVQVAGNFGGAAVRFHVLHDGNLAGAGPSGTAFSLPDALSFPPQTPRRPSTGSALAPAFMNALQQVLAPTGLDFADVHPVLLWTGAIPLASGASADAVVLAVTMPSGAVVTTTAFVSADPTVAGNVCGTSVYPAGTALDSLVVVARCDTSANTGGQQTFLVSAPPGDDRVVLRSSDGTSVAEQPLVNGSGIVPDPGAVATVSVSGPSAAPVQVTLPQHDPLDVN